MAEILPTWRKTLTHQSINQDHRICKYIALVSHIRIGILHNINLDENNVSNNIFKCYSF